MSPKNDPGVGVDYEVYFLTYLSLICLLDDQVEDFEIESNAKNFGKFDDCVVKLTFKNGQKETVCIQLKHKDKDIAIAQLEADNGKFSIQGYFDSYEKEIKDKDKTNFIYILFTNGKISVDNRKKAAKFSIRERSHLKGFHEIFKRTENVHQFSANSELNDECQSFLNNFYFYANQENEIKLEQSIHKLFEENLGSNSDFAIKFIQFFKDLHKGRFANKRVQKRIVEMQLFYLLLKPFILDINGEPLDDNSAFQHFEKLVNLFDVILLRDIKLQTRLIKTPCIPENLDQWAKHNKFIHSGKNSFVDTNELHKLYSWFEHKMPFNLKCSEKSLKPINALIRLNQISNTHHFKFVLVGDEISLAQIIKNENTLYNLLNIETKNRDIYENIINGFSISLKGRKPMILRDFIQVDEDFKKIITVELLVGALKDGIIKIGEEGQKLPDCYIPRTIFQYRVSVESIKQNKNVLFVIHCGSNLDIVKKSLKVNCVTINELMKHNTPSVNVVLVNKTETTEENNILSNFSQSKNFQIVHHAYLCHNPSNNNLNFDWFRCGETGNTINSYFIIKLPPQVAFNFHLSNILQNETTLQSRPSNEIHNINFEWILNTNLTNNNSRFIERIALNEEEIFSYFTNDVELICGRAGIGKSTIMSYLEFHCREYFCVRVNVRGLNDILKDELSFHAFCDKVYYSKDDSQLMMKIKKMYYRRQKILFLFDGFDEIHSKYCKMFFTLLDQIKKKNYKIWISTRPNCRHLLHKWVNGSAVEFEEVQESDQKFFIKRRLKTEANYSDVEVNDTIEKIFQSIHIAKNNNILGTPLLLYIITDILKKTGQHEFSSDFFILTKMYEQFFQGKFRHVLRKENAEHISLFDELFNSRLEKYEIAALKTCLPSEIFDSFNLKISDDLIKSCENDSFGIIVNIQKAPATVLFKFYHQTYAEYLVAKWFENNIEKIPINAREFLLEDRYENIKLMFDMLMAEGCRAHLCVLQKNVEMFEECSQNDLIKTDRQGRNVMHLISSNGDRFPLNKVSKNEFRITNKVWNYEPDPRIQKLLKKLEHSEISLHHKDKFLNKTAIDYAAEQFSVSSLTHIAKIRKLCPEISSQINDNIFVLFFYALKFGYLALFKLRPLVKYFKKNSNRKIAVEMNNIFGSQHVRILTPLCIASIQGHIDIVKKLLSNNADVNLTTDNGVSPLYIASQNGHLDVVKELLSNNADVNLTADNGDSPLWIASQNGHLDVVKELLSNNADVNLTADNEVSPLWIASQNGHLEVIKELLSNNADVNLTADNRVSPLWIASQNGHLEVIKELLSNNADVNLTADNGVSPLYIASQNGHLEVIKELLSNNADVNLTADNGVSPLCIASEIGHLDVVKELVSNNAAVNLTTDNGHSPLYIASHNGHLDVVKELLSNNADVNLTEDNGVSPLCIASQNGHLDVVKELLSNNADVNLTADNGDSPLYIASQNGHLEVIKELLSNNADVNLTADNRVSPLYIASEIGHLDVVKELVSNNAAVNLTTDNGHSPLYIASQTGHLDVVKELLSNNADVNLTANNRASPLCIASQNGHLDVVKELLSNNADVNLTTDNGVSPLNYASHNGHLDVVLELLSNKADDNLTPDNVVSSLNIALKNGHFDIARELQKKTANEQET